MLFRRVNKFANRKTKGTWRKRAGRFNAAVVRLILRRGTNGLHCGSFRCSAGYLAAETERLETAFLRQCENRGSQTCAAVTVQSDPAYFGYDYSGHCPDCSFDCQSVDCHSDYDYRNRRILNSRDYSYLGHNRRHDCHSPDFPGHNRNRTDSNHGCRNDDCDDSS